MAYYDETLDGTRRPRKRSGRHPLFRTPHVRIPWGAWLVWLSAKGLWLAGRCAYRHPRVTLALVLTGSAGLTANAAAAAHGWPLVAAVTVPTAALLVAAGRGAADDRPRVPVRSSIAYRRRWRTAMKSAHLTFTDHGQESVPRLVGVTTEGAVDRVRLRMLPGQELADYGKVASRLAQTFGSRDVRVVSVRHRPHLLDLFVLTGSDPLEETVPPTDHLTTDLKAIEVGRREDGQPFHLGLLGNHVLVAGLTGSGKGSVLWSLILGLAPAVRDGTVRIIAIDPKGGMELVAGRPLFHQFVPGGSNEIATVLEAAVVELQARAGRLQGETRKLTPTVDEPLVVVVIDEVASLTAYVQDAAIKKRIGNALSTLLSQGRAVGYCVVAATQDPRKEVLGMRDLIPTRVALRTGNALEVDLILGQGARDRGARAEAISEHTPGVGYAIVSDMPEPVRVRFAHVTDARISQATGLPPVGGGLCTLYRFYDATDRLLYVGISEHGPERWADHRRSKRWWEDVVRSTMETFPTRAEAAAAELAAIRTEDPAYNVAGAA